MAKSATHTVILMAAVTIAGLLLRLSLVPASVRWGYQGDHDDFARWAIQATDQGLLSVYDHPPPRWNAQMWREGRLIVWQRPLDRPCNYPPLSVYLLYLAGFVFKWVSADRLINTVTSRYVFESWSILADFILAGGCAALVHLYRPGWPARVAYIVAIFAPPFWWDSALWGQMDSVLLAPAVWMVWALVQRRWLLAGLLYGMVAGIKPQAVLFLPIWFVAIACSRPMWKAMSGVALGAGVLMVLSLPFTLHSGLAWWRASYVENIFEAYSQRTTLQAFNIWYLDLLLSDSYDASARWLGITKSMWGRIFLGLALTAGIIWMLVRWRSSGPGLILWSGLTLLGVVILPTQVHERYLLLALPFLIVMACLWARFWPFALVFLVVATSQVTWPLWLDIPPGGWTRAQQDLTQRYEQALAGMSPDAQRKVAPLSEHLRPWRERYDRERRKTVLFEWVMTLLALAGTAGAVFTATFTPRISPHFSDAPVSPSTQGDLPYRNAASRTPRIGA